MDTVNRSSTGTLRDELDAMLLDLEALYRDIHAHPELSLQETRTAGLAAERLRAAVVVVGSLLALPSIATMLVGAALCFGLRLLSIRRGWRLPVAPSPEPATPDPAATADRRAKP